VIEDTLGVVRMRSAPDGSGRRQARKNAVLRSYMQQKKSKKTKKRAWRFVIAGRRAAADPESILRSVRR